MKVSFITTVFNEENGIRFLLDSILTQTKKVDEVVISDAFSTDNTIKIAKSYISSFKKNKISYKIIKKKGNRSVGRNLAIKEAKGEIIVASDSGCTLDKNWVGEITKPFLNPNIDVVSGFYVASFKNIFEKALSTYTCVMKDRVDRNNFLPSSRSVAFRKSAWEKVGGYPKELNTCEDLVFAKKLKKEKLNFIFNPKAIVYWPQRKNILEAARQFFNYAYGDGMAFYIRFQTPILFLRYVLGLALLILYMVFPNDVLGAIIIFILLMYLLWSIQKNYRYVKSYMALIYLPLLQITADIAVITGFTIGLLSRNKK